MAEMWGCLDPLGISQAQHSASGQGHGEMPAGGETGGFLGLPGSAEQHHAVQGFHISPKHRDRAQGQANHPVNAAPSQADAGWFSYLCCFCRAAGNSQIEQPVLIHTCRHLGAILKLSKSLNIPYVYSLEFVDLA